MKNLPDKIYIHGDNDVMGEVLSQRIDGDIEYIRKDVFIKKFCEYLDKNYLFYSKEPHRWVSKIKVIEDFKKYIKGEEV